MKFHHARDVIGLRQPPQRAATGDALARLVVPWTATLVRS
jgi:hypothetical protein